MHWTIQEVARALRAPAPTGIGAMARLAGVSIDSRTVGPGELFFAIHGPRHDGHGFVAAALAAGAAACVVSRERIGEYPAEIQPKLFAVQNTLEALQQLAREVRRAWGGRAAAVAGSVGKTTTKEILAALVAARFRTLKTEGNLNNEYGLPLTLARLEPEHEAAVVELGMSHSGELAALTAIAEPNVGVVTRVAVEHLEFFDSIDAIAAAERELIEGLRGRDAVAVLNADDERVIRFAEAAPGRVVTFGLAARADFRAEQIEDRGAEGSTFTLISPAGRTPLALSLIGRHNVANALAALAAASVWDIGAAEASQVLPRVNPAAMRGEVLHFDGGLTVINDCYNSSPTAMESMLEVLAQTPGSKRRILAAGEMLELGPNSAELHYQAGQAAARHHLDWIIAVRGHAQQMIRGAVECGHPKDRTRFFETSQDAAEFAASLVRPGDLVLVKGSRGVHMERIIEAIREQYARSLAGGSREGAQG